MGMQRVCGCKLNVAAEGGVVILPDSPSRRGLQGRKG